jgi:GTP-binding protein
MISTFITSNTDYKNCPAPLKPEYAFIGRSNVGKSSLINMITDSKKLAKVSGRPGKTQLINHFLIDENWYLVDLPGYGYARTSKENKTKWDEMIRQYLVNRPNLMCVFVLIDSRLEPQKNDTEFLYWLGEAGIPFVIVFTKTDKQTLNHTNALIRKYKNHLLKQWEELPEVFITSSETKKGREEILAFIEKVNRDFEKPE